MNTTRITRPRRARWALLPLAVAAALTVAVVSPAAATTTFAPSRQPVGVSAATTTFRAYLVRGERLHPVRRTVPATVAVAAASVRQLLGGPTSAERAIGFRSQIPVGTQLRGVRIRNGVATVDLTGRFDDGGGSLSMLLRVGQVVFTLTQFPSIERVAFALEGRPVTSIGGEGVIVSPPVDRADFEGQSAVILVESPLPFDVVRSPLRVTGSSNVFEARFRAELWDRSFRRVADAFVLSTSGTGTRGTFDVTLRYRAPAGSLYLVVYQPSPRDGRPIYLSLIPLRQA